jgi:DNA-binding NtrC family response regulator
MTTERKRPTILLVDDENAIRETLGMILTQNGFEVTTVGNVGEALGIFQPRASSTYCCPKDIPETASR